MVNQQSKSIETSRTRAREIKRSMESVGTPIKLQQAYELLAKESGFRTWAAMKASVEAAEKAEPVTAASSSLVVGKTTSLLDELRWKAVDDFVEMMGDHGYNPASVAAGVAYDIVEELTIAQVTEAFSDDPRLADIDTDDEENQSFFGKPETAVDAMRFAIGVELMENIDLRPYAELVAGYGHQRTLARLHDQQRRKVLTSEESSIVIDGVSYPVTRISVS